MKFLKADGTIEEGEPLNTALSAAQTTAIEKFTKFLHENTCGYSFYPSLSRKYCYDIACMVVSKLNNTASSNLLAAIARASKPSTKKSKERKPTNEPTAAL